MRMLCDHENGHGSLWSAVQPIAAGSVIAVEVATLTWVNGDKNRHLLRPDRNLVSR